MVYMYVYMYVCMYIIYPNYDFTTQNSDAFQKGVRLLLLARHFATF